MLNNENVDLDHLGRLRNSSQDRPTTIAAHEAREDPKQEAPSIISNGLIRSYKHSTSWTFWAMVWRLNDNHY